MINLLATELLTKDILSIAFFIYVIVMIIAVFFKLRWLIGVSALLWFIPITLVDNMYIRLISAIMIITSLVIAFYSGDREEF